MEILFSETTERKKLQNKTSTEVLQKKYNKTTR